MQFHPELKSRPFEPHPLFASFIGAPKGPYNLTMRIYAPKSDALTGRWNPPPVVKVQTVPAAAQ